MLTVQPYYFFGFQDLYSIVIVTHALRNAQAVQHGPTPHT